MRLHRLRWAGVAAAVLFAVGGHAERKAVFGEYAVHYTVFNATFLRPQIAERYGIARERDRAVANISVLDAAGRAVEVPLTGSFRNLLGRVESLRFRTFRAGDAVYYLATLTYPHAEVLRFEIVADLPGYGPATVSFQQALYQAAPSTWLKMIATRTAR